MTRGKASNSLACDPRSSLDPKALAHPLLPKYCLRVYHEPVPQVH